LFVLTCNFLPGVFSILNKGRRTFQKDSVRWWWYLVNIPYYICVCNFKLWHEYCWSIYLL